jgi:hypothetical protein
MRYSIMLQLVAGTTLILVGAAALFGWIQNRAKPMKSGICPVSSGTHCWEPIRVGKSPASKAIPTHPEIALLQKGTAQNTVKCFRRNVV